MAARFRKRLVVVGDRILIRPQDGEERTGAGLYVPATAVRSRSVQGGTVVAVGPGFAVPDPTDLDAEPWQSPRPAPEAKYVPLQAKEGDYALFIQNAAVEITFEDTRYLIVPNSAVLVLVREDIDLDSSGSD